MLLTLIEAEDGELAAGSACALAFARGIADELGTTVEAVTFERAHWVKDDIARHGVSTLHVVEHDRCAEYVPEFWGDALAQLLRQLAPSGALAATTDRASEVMARAAARTDLPLAANCVAVSSGESWQLRRQRGGGMLLEEAELTAPIKLLTIAPGAAEPAPSAVVGEISLETFTPVFDTLPVHGKLVERAAAESGVTLATAPVVVSGGRGVGSAEGFAPLEELAGLLGGAVGCSRVVTNNGWRSHSSQVGLTGTKIAPELYIACGISGATQHWVGMMDARKILAINTDAEAPMVTRATYAVIGDVQEVLPAIIEEVKRRKQAAA